MVTLDTLRPFHLHAPPYTGDTSLSPCPQSTNWSGLCLTLVLTLWAVAIVPVTYGGKVTFRFGAIIPHNLRTSLLMCVFNYMIICMCVPMWESQLKCNYLVGFRYKKYTGTIRHLLTWWQDGHHNGFSFEVFLVYKTYLHFLQLLILHMNIWTSTMSEVTMIVYPLDMIMMDTIR